MKKLIFALKEEIGKTDLFVGRKQELEMLLHWTQLVKEELAQSLAILARRKKGKTALVQRLFNHIYTENDSQVIPFYFVIPESPISVLGFSDLFYRSLISQYLGFKHRKPEWIRTIFLFKELKELAKDDAILLSDIERMESLKLDKNSSAAWEYARQAGHRISSLKDERIIQIIDEFQFLNQYIYSDESYNTRMAIASAYQRTAESKISPQIITGSYVGWLTKIIQSMVSRYREISLKSLAPAEALEAVYKYTEAYQIPVSDKTAPYLAEVCFYDAYYIAQVVRSFHPEKDFTTEEGIRETLKFETTAGKGDIAKVWLEYLEDAIEEVNDVHAKKIILYLAKQGDKEIGRDQILETIDHGLTDNQLEKRLRGLVHADILARGTTNFHYKGLGDPVFEIVFRRLYETEIQKVDLNKVEKEIEQKLIEVRNRANYDRGLLGEYRLKQQIEDAVRKGVELKDLVYNPETNLTLESIDSIRKDRIYLSHEKSVEIDLYLRAEKENGSDFAIEVKNWERKVSMKAVMEFIEKVKLLKTRLNNTGYILYSQKGFTDDHKKLLEKEGIMYTDEIKLESYSM